MAAHQRKVELQSSADLTYLYANTVALSRKKLDLYFPLQQQTMRHQIRCANARTNLEPESYINRTFITASASISINGIDSSHPQFPFPASFTAPETVEYEPYDTELASRVTTLYAQLESLTTTVAQQRRDAPRQAAKDYAAQLMQVLKDEDEDDDIDEKDAQTTGGAGEDKDGAMDVDAGDGSTKPKETEKSHSRRNRPDPSWELQVPLGTDAEAERWRSGDMAEVYERALRTLQRLQGEADVDEEGSEGNALATTVGKAERAGRAADVVESM
ncbi:Kinetochore Mis14 [Penicillium pulvis]|uniref:Kinetochore Mis14 n=1 Tax=Penicillium pulvis TaxID=1562058 RepID=UPI0025477197|nr:Kinetochore Mis14 [Penicillium pulvis]KAJ5792945.1 Kinetochore Mis14 [Penicillium pulvis]